VAAGKVKHSRHAGLKQQGACKGSQVMQLNVENLVIMHRCRAARAPTQLLCWTQWGSALHEAPAGTLHGEQLPQPDGAIVQ
jgi:hypothetical protein